MFLPWKSMFIGWCQDGIIRHHLMLIAGNVWKPCLCFSPLPWCLSICLWPVFLHPDPDLGPDPAPWPCSLIPSLPACSFSHLPFPCPGLLPAHSAWSPVYDPGYDTDFAYPAICIYLVWVVIHCLLTHLLNSLVWFIQFWYIRGAFIFLISAYS